VDRDPLYSVAPAQLDGGKEVPVESVHAPEAEETDEMEGAARLLCSAAERDQGLEVEEAAVGDALVDPDEILRHHPAGAEVEVSDLAVAHLTFGESDGQAARVEKSTGLGGPQAVPDGRVAELDGVADAFSAVSPAVEHHERYGTPALKSV